MMLDDMTQEALLLDMPAGTKLLMENCADNHKALVIKDQKDAFGYIFTLGPNGACKLDTAWVNARGTNLSAVVLRNVNEVLPEMGVRSMEINANEIGAYLWGRAGFAPFPNVWEGMVPKLEKRLDYLVSVNGPELQDSAAVMRQHLKQPNPKTLWKIADCKDALSDGSPLGKAMLLAWTEENFADFKALTEDSPQALRPVISWRGKLDLQDSESDDRLYDYIETAENMLASKKAAIAPKNMQPQI